MEHKKLEELSQEELLAKAQELQKENETKTQELNDQQEVVEQLKSEVDLKKDVTVLPTVTVNKKKYAFTCKSFTVPSADRASGDNVTAEDAAKDKDLLEKLVKSGSGVLSLVSKK